MGLVNKKKDSLEILYDFKKAPYNSWIEIIETPEGKRIYDLYSTLKTTFPEFRIDEKFCFEYISFEIFGKRRFLLSGLEKLLKEKETTPNEIIAINPIKRKEYERILKLANKKIEKTKVYFLTTGIRIIKE